MAGNLYRIAFLVCAMAVLCKKPEPADEVKTRMGLDKRPVKSHKERYSFLVKGNLSDMTVGYPAVLINSDTVVSYMIEELETPSICDEQVCTRPRDVNTHENYTFWTLDLGIRKRKIMFYEGNVTEGVCKLNRKETRVTLTKVEGTEREYQCEAGCNSYDVVICNDTVAGILEGFEDKATFIFHNISDILIAGGFDIKNARVGAVRKGKLKSIVVKVRFNDNETEVSYPAALINANTVVTFAADIIENPKICDSIRCIDVARMETMGNYTFWYAPKLKKKPPKFYRTDITQAICNLNRSNRKNKFDIVRPPLLEYRCNGSCAQSDILICNNKLAGFLSIENGSTFVFHNINAVLKMAQVDNETDDVNYGASKMNIRKLVYDINVDMDGENVTFPAVHISNDVLASYHVKNATLANTEACLGSDCESLENITVVGNFTFLKLKSPKPIDPGTLKIFRGDIVKSKCSLNRLNERTKLNYLPSFRPRYKCSTVCRKSDVVVCSGRIAGLIGESGEEGEEGEYIFHDIDTILNTGGYQIKSNLGAVKPLPRLSTPASRRITRPPKKKPGGGESGNEGIDASTDMGSTEKPDDGEETEEEYADYYDIVTTTDSTTSDVTDDDDYDTTDDDYDYYYDGGHENSTGRTGEANRTKSTDQGGRKITKITTSTTPLVGNYGTSVETMPSHENSYESESATQTTQTTKQEDLNETTILTSTEKQTTQQPEPTMPQQSSLAVTTQPAIIEHTETTIFTTENIEGSIAQTPSTTVEILPTTQQTPPPPTQEQPLPLYIKAMHEEGGEKHLPSIFIKKGILASSKVADTEGAMVCINWACKFPEEAKSVENYTFWKIRDDKQEVPQFFQGQPDGASCTRNGKNGVEFVPIVEDVYACKPECEVSDVIWCDGKLAGIITGKKLENVAALGKASDILALVESPERSSKNRDTGTQMPIVPRSDLRLTTKKMDDSAVFVRKSGEQAKVSSIRECLVVVFSVLTIVLI